MPQEITALIELVVLNAPSFAGLLLAIYWFRSELKDCKAMNEKLLAELTERMDGRHK